LLPSSAGRKIAASALGQLKEAPMLTFMRKIALFAGLAILAGGLVFMTSGWRFHLDDRRPSQSRMVGTLTIDLPEGSGQGTAVVISECGILTAFHVVFGPWYVTAIREPSHEFVATFTLTEVTLPDGTHPSTRATPVVWGDYRGADRQFRRAGEDWVYLSLDECFGNQYGYLKARPLEPEDLADDSLELSTIGYSAGVQMRDPRCRIRADDSPTTPGAWPHDCILLPGDSGGPVLKGNTLTLVALGSGIVARPGDLSCSYAVVPGVRVRHDGKPECVNLAVPILPQITDRIAKAEAAIGVQRCLQYLGFDVGPLGLVDGPKLKAAIEQTQRSLGLPVTGEPSHALHKILWMQIDLG
jgi:hypothetical protein